MAVVYFLKEKDEISALEECICGWQGLESLERKWQANKQERFTFWDGALKGKVAATPF